MTTLYINDANTGEPVAVDFGSIDDCTYLGQQVIVGSGSGVNKNATLPDGTKTIWITAEGGKVYAAVNTTASPTTAGIYVPDGNVRIAGPFTGITSLGVYAASGVYAHLMYES